MFNLLDAIIKTESNNKVAIVQLNVFALRSVVSQLCIPLPNKVHPLADVNPTKKNTPAIIADEIIGFNGSAN